LELEPIVGQEDLTLGDQQRIKHPHDRPAARVGCNQFDHARHDGEASDLGHAVADQSDRRRGTVTEVDRVETGQVVGGVRERGEGALAPKPRRDVKAAVVDLVEGKAE
jgi:hypothetical protein